MVDGHETLSPLLAVDLDGTYLRGNSLHIYLRQAMAWHMRRLRPDRTARIAFWLAIRKAGWVKHRTMKLHALAAAGREKALLERFAHVASQQINPAVTEIIEQCRKDGWNILLASAAADFYIPYIWEGDFVATDMSGGKDYVECRGAEKATRVVQWAAEHNCRLQGVVTDHPDDRPLLDANPNKEFNFIVDKATGTVKPQP